MPLMKVKFLRVGQVNKSTQHPLRNGHGPLFLTEMKNTPLEGASGGQKGNEAPHTTWRLQSAYHFALVFCGNCRTAGDEDWDTTTATLTELTDLHHSPTWLRPKCLCFFAITLQMGHCLRDKLTDYRVTTNQFYTRFYSTFIKQDRILHILCFVHFTDNNNEPDMMEENSDVLCKIRNLSEILNKIFSIFYSPSEHLAVDEVIVLFKGRFIFRQYIPKKRKYFGFSIYKPCDETWYT
jgi:hypothetical protein